MAPFRTGHAAHPDWRIALARAADQVDATPATDEPTLGWCYFGDAYAPDAEALAAALHERWPGVAWVGASGVGVSAGGVEYFDEPALVLMLTGLPRSRFTLFSGRRPLAGGACHTAMVHADPATPELPELIRELADRTETGYLFGGLASAHGPAVQLADGVCRGGLSGVGFDAGVVLASRVTQGCQPIGPARGVTACDGPRVLALDGAPAWPQLLADLGFDADTDPRVVLPRLRETLAGVSDADTAIVGRGGQFGADTRVRHLIGVDPSRGAVVVADTLAPGMRLAFCRRDAAAARRDLVRICSELREWLAESQPSPDGDPVRRVAGAIYVSCAGRGGPHFGAPSAELQIVRHALGDVPLAGFFAAGEVARHHLYGYTGVLTVFAVD
jgi:small ligand-binding sensory domain FIST